MRLIIPTGLIALLSSLDQAIIRCGLCDPEDSLRLSESFRNRLAPAYRELSELSEQHAETKRVWHLALARRRHAFDQLCGLIRDTWLVLRRRDQREHHAGLLVTLFKLPRHSPQHASPALWLEHGRNLVHGDALAQAAGYGSLVWPDVEALASCLAEATAAESHYRELTVVLKQQAHALRENQRKAAHLLRCLAARLRESQFDQPEDQTRNLLRNFGFRFKTTPSDDAQARAEQEADQAPPQRIAAASTSAERVPVAAHPPARQEDAADGAEHPPEGQPLKRTLVDWAKRLPWGDARKRHPA